LRARRSSEPDCLPLFGLNFSGIMTGDLTRI
jgi:hypothetical protein